MAIQTQCNEELCLKSPTPLPTESDSRALMNMVASLRCYHCMRLLFIAVDWCGVGKCCDSVYLPTLVGTFSSISPEFVQFSNSSIACPVGLRIIERKIMRPNVSNLKVRTPYVFADDMFGAVLL